MTIFILLICQSGQSDVREITNMRAIDRGTQLVWKKASRHLAAHVFCQISGQLHMSEQCRQMHALTSCPAQNSSAADTLKKAVERLPPARRS